MTHDSLRPADGLIAPVERPTLWRASIAYTILVLAAVGGFFLIRHYGETLAAGAPARAATDSVAHSAPSAAGHALFHVLLALAAVIALGQLLSVVFSRIGQPPVIGEVLAGILLGPSLIGQQASSTILPPDTAPYLGLVAQLGAILYLFVIGLELNGDWLRGRTHAIIATSHASIIVPFLLGALLALWLYPALATADVPFTSFALFMGVAMSITAFPVLARILSDRGMTRSPLGVVALSCAAVDDVTAWCLLALVVGVARAEAGQGLTVALYTAIYLSFMLVVVRPILARLVLKWEGQPVSRSAAALIFVALLASAAATEFAGIHALFGAFMLGAVIPHRSAVAHQFSQQLERVTTVLLLPAFFAFTGMRTRIDLVSGWNQWGMCLVIILVATLGKFGGTLAAARLTGLDWRKSAALGTLMNTRGLMELIVLNVGLDLGVISRELFAMMVLMALVTTMAAAPLLRLLLTKEDLEPSPGAPDVGFGG